MSAGVLRAKVMKGGRRQGRTEEEQQMGAQPNANIFFVFLFACHNVIYDDFYTFGSLRCQRAIKQYKRHNASKNKAPRWPLCIYL